MSLHTVKIEIVSSAVNVLKGTSKRTGNDYEMRTQEAYLHNGHTYPDRFEAGLRKDSSGNWLPAYEPGFYTIAPGSVRVNREFSKLELNPFDLEFLRMPESEQGKYAAKPAKVA